MIMRKSSYGLLALCICAAFFLAGLEVSAEMADDKAEAKIKKQKQAKHKLANFKKDPRVTKKKKKIRQKLGPVAREQKKHTVRTVRIKRLEELAKAMKRQDLLTKIKKMRENESARHEKAMKRVREGRKLKKMAPGDRELKKRGMKKGFSKGIEKRDDKVKGEK